MEHVEQGDGKAGLDAGEFVEGDRRFIELAVFSAVVENLVDDLAQVLRGDLAQRAGSGLDAVG